MDGYTANNSTSWGGDSGGWSSYDGSNNWGGDSGSSGNTMSDWGYNSDGSYQGGNFGDGGFGDYAYSTGGWDDPSNTGQFDPGYQGDPAAGNDDFGKRFRNFLQGVVANKVTKGHPLTGALMGAINAPEGRRMEGFGRGMGSSAVNAFVGAVPGLGMINTLSGLFGGPTAGSMFNRATSTPNPQSANPQSQQSTGNSLAQLAGGLAGMYSANRAGNELGGLAGNLKSMYGQNSPYAKQLRQTLERKDAASGRRSQYGPREVELQARLAEMNSRNAPHLANIYQQNSGNRNAMLNNLLKLGQQSGAFNAMGRGLDGMFDASQGFTGNNDFRNPDSFWEYGSSGD